MNRAVTLMLSWMVIAPSLANAQDADKGNNLTVMTFNLRYASATGADNWPARRPVMADLFKNTTPDLIGTQEGLYAQLKDIASDLPNHSWIGLGREGGSRGEFMAVFYRKDRLDPLEYDHFWLSDTPDVIGSATWGNKVKRMVTWVRFLDRKTQQQFYFVNTHFDHQVEESRQKSAALVRQRIDALKTTLPILLVGDFNTGHNQREPQHPHKGQWPAECLDDRRPSAMARTSARFTTTKAPSRMASTSTGSCIATASPWMTSKS